MVNYNMQVLEDSGSLFNKADIPSLTCRFGRVKVIHWYFLGLSTKYASNKNTEILIQKQGFLVNMPHFGPVSVYIVQFIHVNPFDSLRNNVGGNVGVFALP